MCPNRIILQCKRGESRRSREAVPCLRPRSLEGVVDRSKTGDNVLSLFLVLAEPCCYPCLSVSACLSAWSTLLRWAVSNFCRPTAKIRAKQVSLCHCCLCAALRCPVLSPIWVLLRPKRVCRCACLFSLKQSPIPIFGIVNLPCQACTIIHQRYFYVPASTSHLSKKDYKK